MVHSRRYSGEVRHDTCRHPFARLPYNIPSKKEHGQIYYSKLHFDLSKNSAEESKAEYYTVKEAMEKFNLSRDSVYNILQFHQIPREKNGRFVRFLKVDFDRVMGVRK